MTRYLLDTNAISDLIRNRTGPVAGHMRRVGDGSVCTSVIVAAELLYGAHKKGSDELKARVAAALGALDVLPFEPPADQAYAAIRADLEARGRPISANDLFIAAHARSLDLTLVTDNEREFARVEGLRCENWVRG